MAHYAFINKENIVVEVITGRDETDSENLPEGFANWEEYYETRRDGLTCKRTSYNTIGNEHILGGTPFRGNYAWDNYSYDPDNDVFISPMPVIDGWTFTLDETTWSWVGTEE